MDKAYADTVRLLLAIVPDVFANDIFAMKGGTAINLVVQDMPRLSVDATASAALEAQQPGNLPQASPRRLHSPGRRTRCRLESNLTAYAGKI